MTRPLRRAVLVLACLALCGGLLAACGGDDDKGDAGANQLLQQTFGNSASAIETGRLNLSFQLDPEGLLALGGPIKLRLDGPFAAPARGDLPRFDVDFLATLAGQRFDGGVQSTGKQAFVTLDKRPYRVDGATVADLREGLGPVSGDKPQAGLKAIGIDPLRWISNAQEKGSERVAGVDTTRIGGNVDAERLLADLDRLLTKAGGASGAGAGSLLTPKLRTQIADAVETAKVDVWTGTSDKLLRQLAVAIKFAFEKGTEPPIPGLDAGTIDLRLRLDDVNETKVDVRAPSSPRPLSRLTGGSLGNFLQGIGEGLTNGSSGLVGGALLKCINGAGGKSTSLVRCVSKLAA
ncbi:MAG: hypothetical protein ACRDLN_10275 [Solirubrobacteraceae bacterium]